MRKPTGHKEKHSIKSVISKIESNDGTAARTRPFSFDEIMLRRKNKKKSGNVEDHRVGSKVVGSKEAESVFDRLDSGSHRHKDRDVFGGSEGNASKDELKKRKDKIVESEHKKCKNAHIRSKIVSDNVKDRINEGDVHENRKNQDWPTDDFDHEYGKKHVNKTEVKVRDRNVERKIDKSENVGKRKTENGYNERDREQDAGKKYESRKGYDSNTSERKQRKGTSESHHEDLKSKYDERETGQDVRKKHEARKGYDFNTSERPKGTSKSHHEDLKLKYDERERDQDVGKKHESRKGYDSNTSERHQLKGAFEAHYEDLKSKYNELDRDQDVGKKRDPRKLSDSGTSERKQRKGTFESHQEDLKSKYDERDSDRDAGKKHEPRKLYDSNTSEKKKQRATFESHHEDMKSKYEERNRDQDVEKKNEPRKLNDSNSSERKQQKRTSESHREDLKSRSKRSRSREDEREKHKKSNSPSPRGHQRIFETRGHEELISHSSEDRKKISNNGSGNKSKRHDSSASRLGGYSPRKRRSEAAVKTPSPTKFPEKKNTWDSPSVKLESSLSLLNKTEVSNKHDVSSVGPLTPVIPKPNFGVISSIPLMMNASVDSVQLTQATRPKRRIYVENLPSSASEADVMQWISGYLRPYGVNHVPGTSPCISCIVNKEKGQALVEFLTPEDASTALCFDGKSFSGNILKIRRPKDYVEATTGVSEKPVAGSVSVKNIVEDSSNKIFIGGISKVITSEMLMEIASAFGPLKAYHFEDNNRLGSPCAFIEYADQSVTVKACVGLNGMMLGGHVLTVTQATPDASSAGDHIDQNQPFYGTPVHAQPLLEKPTQVLKLNNLLDSHSLPSLSASELEEILEDIRLECARFGMVKSINIIKQIDISEPIKVVKEADSRVDEVSEPTGSDQEKHKEVEESAPIGGLIEPESINGAVGVMADSPVENQNMEENSNQISHEIDQLELNDSKSTDDIVTENKTLEAELHDTAKDYLSESNININFEVGSVLVEYKRTEASSIAAHCLHGRVFDGRTVTVEYVAHDVYRTRFCK